MQPGKCFVLRNGETEENGNYDFVLTTVDDGGKRRVSVEHYQVDDKDQEWFWNEKDGRVYNNAFPEEYLDTKAGANRSMFLSAKNDGGGQLGFDYQNDQFLTGDAFAFTVDHDT